MKTYFEIVPFSYYAEDCSLVCELTYEGISFALKNIKEHKYVGLGVYHFENRRPLAGFPIALELLINSKPFLNKNYSKVSVVYSVPESVLIPFSLYNSSTAPNAISLLYGDVDNQEKVMTDVISESQYFNCYRVKKSIVDVLEKRYPESGQWHQYSSLIGGESGRVKKMHVIFYSYKVVVALYNEGKCILVNTYPYQSAQDIVYYLLSVRNIFSMDDVNLEVSGFIEKDSTVFQEIYKYFLDISFKPLPEFCEYSDDIKQYPAHYFSHLFALDGCG